MGPPDKFEESVTHGDSTVRGSIIWWIYYRYGLGIEFVDEKANGSYRIRNYEGEFFEAIDILKMGASVGTADAFLKKVIKFDLSYDPAAGEIEIALPAKSINFKENDKGEYVVDLRFKFYVYAGAGQNGLRGGTELRRADGRDRFPEGRPLPLRSGPRPGVNYIDVIIQGRDARSGRIRRLLVRTPEPGPAAALTRRGRPA